MFKQLSNWIDDPAGTRWINSDLISFTCKMKNKYSCFEKGCLTNGAKLTATILKVIMGNAVFTVA